MVGVEGAWADCCSLLFGEGKLSMLGLGSWAAKRFEEPATIDEE
jgi:hypothetical protein